MREEWKDVKGIKGCARELKLDDGSIIKVLKGRQKKNMWWIHL